MSRRGNGVRNSEIRVVYAFGPQLNAFMAVGILLKVHLTPNFFFAKSNLLVICRIWAQKCLDLLESSIFYALSMSRLKCCTTESGAAVADDVCPGTKHNGASVCSLYLLEKMESKINRSNIFWN